MTAVTIISDVMGIIPQICAVSAIVLLAMTIDLCSGLYKARLRGEIHSSWGLKRSVSKFILYEGAILIAGCIDALFAMGKVASTFGLATLDKVAIFGIIVGVILCVVEIWSLREKADEKTRKDVDRATQILSHCIDKNAFIKILTEAFEQSLIQAKAKEKEQ